jgi:hypothetical protein
MVLNDHAKLDESYQSTERTFVLPDAKVGSPPVTVKATPPPR